MNAATLDAGALIAIERADRRVTALLMAARARGARLAVPAAALAQVWRGGARQARLAALQRSRFVDVVPLDGSDARLAGQLCGLRGTTDVVDASVVICARRRPGVVLTSDPADLLQLDARLRVVPV